MKKFILSILFILLITNSGFTQGGYGQQGGITGLSVVNNNLVFGAPIDSVIFEIPVSAEASFTFETLIGTVFKIFNAAGDSMILNPNGFSSSNSAVAGTAVFNYKSRGGHSVIIDSLSAYVSVMNSPTANAALMQLGTSADADRFKVDEDGDVTADGSIAASGALSGTTITGTGKISTIVTTKQFELGYDATNLFDITLLDDGHTTFTTVDPDGAEADITFAPDGNVGIKTAAPSTALEVTGRVTASTGFTDGTFTVDGSGNFSGVGTFTFGNGAILNNSTVDLLTITEATVDIEGAFTASSVASDGTVSGTGATFTSLTLDLTQDYLFTERTNLLVIQSQTSGTISAIEFFSKDGDGSDAVEFRLYGEGTPGDITNRERFMIRYKATGVFTIETEAQGTGTLRPLLLFTEGNTDQICLETDGDVLFGSGGVYTGLNGNEENWLNVEIFNDSTVTTETTLSSVLPAGYIIDSIIFKNTTANEITNLDIGFSDGGGEIVAAANLLANDEGSFTLLQKVDDFDAADTVYISATNWNSANLIIYIRMVRIF